MPIQAELHRIPYDPEKLLHQIRSTLFPNLKGQIGLLFSKDEPLANVTYKSANEPFPAVITINSIQPPRYPNRSG